MVLATAALTKVALTVDVRAGLSDETVQSEGDAEGAGEDLPGVA